MFQAIKIRPIPEQAKKLLAIIQEKEEAKEIGIYYSGGWVSWFVTKAGSVVSINNNPIPEDQKFVEFLIAYLDFWFDVQTSLDNGE